MNLNVYSLQSNYANLFLYAGEGGTETIFARRYAKSAQATGQNNGIFGEYGPPTNSGPGRVVPIRALVDFYQMIDGKTKETSPLYNPAPYPNASGTIVAAAWPLRAKTSAATSRMRA